jgi:hypothetical protein
LQEFTVLQNGYFYRSLGDGWLVEAAGEKYSNLSPNLLYNAKLKFIELKAACLTRAKMECS